MLPYWLAAASFCLVVSAAVGAGAGSEVMQDRPNQVVTLAQTMRNLIQYDPSGDTELIYRALRDQGY